MPARNNCPLTSASSASWRAGLVIGGRFGCSALCGVCGLLAQPSVILPSAWGTLQVALCHLSRSSSIITLFLPAMTLQSLEWEMRPFIYCCGVNLRPSSDWIQFSLASHHVIVISSVIDFISFASSSGSSPSLKEKHLLGQSSSLVLIFCQLIIFCQHAVSLCRQEFVIWT